MIPAGKVSLDGPGIQHPDTVSDPLDDTVLHAWREWLAYWRQLLKTTSHGGILASQSSYLPSSFAHAVTEHERDATGPDEPHSR